MLEDDFWRERPGLNVAAFLKFEQITAVAQYDAFLQLFEDAFILRILATASPTLGHVCRKGDCGL